MITEERVVGYKASTAFAIVCDHLLTQKAKATTSFDNPLKDGQTTQCAYRGDGGLKCAIGCLIPDDMYTPYIEGCNAQELLDGVIVANTLFRINIFLRDPNEYRTGEESLELRTLFTRLQSVHDSYDPSDWEYRLALIKNRFKELLI